MAYLLDTNVILRWLQPHDVQHAIALSAIENLIRASETLYVTPQSLCEFWNVATRSIERNGYGLTTLQAKSLVQHIEMTFLLAPDIPTIYPHWRRLVAQYSVTGIRVFDTRLLAVMKAYSIENILTFNVADFNQYVTDEFIRVVHPANVPETQIKTDNT